MREKKPPYTSLGRGLLVGALQACMFECSWTFLRVTLGGSEIYVMGVGLSSQSLCGDWTHM